MNCSGED
jgi:hypothetical protein